MKVTLLGAHQSETSTTKSTSILIDDILAIDAGSLAAGLTLAEQEKLKSILLTHSHFDHIKDLPTLSYNTAFYSHTKIYSSQFVKQVLINHVFNNNIWPNFAEIPPTSPSISFVEIEPLQDILIDNYLVRGVPVDHTVPCMGYQITAEQGQGNSLFYTSDTGTLSPEIWHQVNPQLIISEVTYANAQSELAAVSKHLTPRLLAEGLNILRSMGRPIPRLVVIHTNPADQPQVEIELAEISLQLGIQIGVGYEGMILEV